MRFVVYLIDGPDRARTRTYFELFSRVAIKDLQRLCLEKAEKEEVAMKTMCGKRQLTRAETSSVVD